MNKKISSDNENKCILIKWFKKQPKEIQENDRFKLLVGKPELAYYIFPDLKKDSQELYNIIREYLIRKIKINFTEIYNLYTYAYDQFQNNSDYPLSSDCSVTIEKLYELTEYIAKAIYILGKYKETSNKFIEMLCKSKNFMTTEGKDNSLDIAIIQAIGNIGIKNKEILDALDDFLGSSNISETIASLKTYSKLNIKPNFRTLFYAIERYEDYDKRKDLLLAAILTFAQFADKNDRRVKNFLKIFLEIRVKVKKSKKLIRFVNKNGKRIIFNKSKSITKYIVKNEGRFYYNESTEMLHIYGDIVDISPEILDKLKKIINDPDVISIMYKFPDYLYTGFEAEAWEHLKNLIGFINGQDYHDQIVKIVNYARETYRNLGNNYNAYEKIKGICSSVYTEIDLNVKSLIHAEGDKKIMKGYYKPEFNYKLEKINKELFKKIVNINLIP